MTVVTGAINEGTRAEDLLARAAAGDEVAFTRIVALHHDAMVRVASIVTGQTDLADEAASAAWTIAWRRLRDVRDPARLRSWLVSVAANEARALVRRRGRTTLVEIDVAEALPGSSHDDPASRAAALDLANALGRLSPDDRALLALRYVAGLDSSELARATGRSASGTRARLARLLGRLRVELSDD